MKDVKPPPRIFLYATSAEILAEQAKTLAPVFLKRRGKADVEYQLVRKRKKKRQVELPAPERG